MKFDMALRRCMQGKKISRKGWNGKSQYVVLATMDKCHTIEGEILINPNHEDIGANFLLFVGTRGYQCGWLASQGDMLADDWFVV